MTYQPNIKDARVIERIKHAYVFTKIISNHRTNALEYNLSQTLIDKHFGQSQTNLSKWLRKNLLVCTNHGYSIEAKVTKKYRINETGSAIIRHVLKNKELPVTQLDYKTENSNPTNIKFDDKIIKEVVKRDFANELQTGDFVYTDKSGRLWHPIQNIKRDEKKKLLAESGYNYQYDIEACAPTLILQYAQQLGMDEYLFAINKYLKDKKQIRTELAELIDMPERTAKVVINALFCGARLGASQDFALFHELACDEARVIAVKEDEYITELRSDIKKCWDEIKTTLPRRSVTDKNGRNRLLAVSSRQKWGVYFDLERQVLNAIRVYLKKTNNKFFTEHDGWACEKQVDLIDLQRYIKDATGFSVNFSEELLSDPSLRAASVTSSIPSFANAHSDIDSLQQATPYEMQLNIEHNTHSHYSPIVYNISYTPIISNTTWLRDWLNKKKYSHLQQRK